MERPVASFAPGNAHVAAVELARRTPQLVLHFHALVQLQVSVEQSAVLFVDAAETPTARRVLFVDGFEASGWVVLFFLDAYLVVLVAVNADVLSRLVFLEKNGFELVMSETSGAKSSGIKLELSYKLW